MLVKKVKPNLLNFGNKKELKQPIQTLKTTSNIYFKNLQIYIQFFWVRQKDLSFISYRNLKETENY